MSIQLKDVIHFYIGCKVLVDDKEIAKFRGGTLVPNSINQIYYDLRTKEMEEDEGEDFSMPYNDDYGDGLRIKPILRRLSDLAEAEALHIARLAFFDQDMKYPDGDYTVYKPEPIAVDKIPTTISVTLSNDWWDKEIRIGLNTGTIWYTNRATNERVWNYQKIFVFLHKQQFDLYGLIDSGQAIDAKSISQP